jgi:hypothetical protein
MSADLNPSKRTVLDIAADLANGRTSGRELVETALAQIADSAGEGASELGQRVENRTVMVPPGDRCWRMILDETDHHVRNIRFLEGGDLLSC